MREKKLSFQTKIERAKPERRRDELALPRQLGDVNGKSKGFVSDRFQDWGLRGFRESVNTKSKRKVDNLWSTKNANQIKLFGSGCG